MPAGSSPRLFDASRQTPAGFFVPRQGSLEFCRQRR
jgi:hypothetical protein